jgi:hypothetical protein
MNYPQVCEKVTNRMAEIQKQIIEAINKATEDAMIYGSGYLQFNADGSVNHISPSVLSIDVVEALNKQKEKERVNWHNNPNCIMQAHDINTTGHDDRYRNCVQMGCGKSFRFTHEDEWTCASCQLRDRKAWDRHKTENALLNANRVLK